MRRKLLSIATIVMALVPVGIVGAAGIAYVAGPLREDSWGPWYYVAEISSLPADGAPRTFPVYATQRNSWVRQPQGRLVDALLRWDPAAEQVVAFRPDIHRRMLSVRYDAQVGKFRTNCWGSIVFDLDGKEEGIGGQRILDQNLTRLPVRIVDGSVFVFFDDR